jgi:ABC-type Zn uptake system ZnuABC Zn-binding protein ZnuA
LPILLLAIACGEEPATDAPAQAAPAASGSSPAQKSATTAVSPAATPAVSGAARPAVKTGIVTTSNIVADWVQAVGRDRVDVFSLLPPNADPHTFQPGARDVAQVADADLVFSVGLALEGGWLDGLVHNAAGDPGKIVPLGEAVDPINFGEIFEEHGDAEHEGAEDSHDGQEGEHEGGEDEDHGHGGLDPHFWFDPLRVKQAVDTIGAQLAAADPAGRTFYQDNAAAYNRELDGLHTWIQQEVAKLPEERRLLVTSHDTLQYFAQRYGFRVVGAIMPATTDAEPTGQALAELIETIEHAGVPAVFAEKSHSAQLSRRVSEETGAELIGGLYTGSLGAPGGEAGTYLDLMRYDVNTIVDALQ